MDVEAYRRSADEFLAALESEYYRHFAGLKPCYEIEPIYSRHAELFEPRAVEGLRRAACAVEGEQRRRLAMLLRFALEGLIGQRCQQLESELAAREAALALEVEGLGTMPLRAAPIRQAHEPDPARREAIERARLEAVEATLNPLHRELQERRQEVCRELGHRSYRELCEELQGLDLRALGDQAHGFLKATEAAYAHVLERPLRDQLGFAIGHLRRGDLPRFFRFASADRWFAGERLVDSFERTLAGMGIELRSQSGLVLDLERRPGKSPRAFCAPVRPPEEVYLVISPAGGFDDYGALFHEGGHAEHAAAYAPGLALEYARLGDNAIGECWAFLLQHLIESPAWLERVLGVEDPEPILHHARAQRLIYLRRYCAKLIHELDLHSGMHPLSDSALRYDRLLSEALQMRWGPETFLSDVDPHFYSACYLRAWALEPRVRGWLLERFGDCWFSVPEAGAELVSLWSEGQRLGPEQLLERLSLPGGVELGVLVGELGIR